MIIIILIILIIIIMIIINNTSQSVVFSETLPKSNVRIQKKKIQI